MVCKPSFFYWHQQCETSSNKNEALLLFFFKGNTSLPRSSNYIQMEYPGIGRSLVFLAVQGLVYFGILIFLDSGTFHWLKYRLRLKYRIRNHYRKYAAGSVQPDDEGDVRNERMRIARSPLKNLLKSDTIVMQNLSRRYGKKVAVDRLNLGVASGECIGFIGVNGSGKSSTFKMLTGHRFVTSGEAYVGGCNVVDDIDGVWKQIGYCPQRGGFIDYMTVRETLEMYARLRGVPDDTIFEIVYLLMKELLLKPVADRKAGTLR